MAHGRDRRNTTRVSYICEIECEADSDAAGTTRVKTRISDLSLSGAFIDTTACFAPGTLLTLTFQGGETRIRTIAEVRHTMPQSGMGVRFVGLIPEHRAALAQLFGEDPHSAEEHGSNAQPGPGQKLFLGSFSVISLFDVIQMIENSRLTGVLIVVLSFVRGEVYFNEGEIVGAAVEGEYGGEALARLLNPVEGTFEFRKSAAHFRRTIQASSNIGLLLELLRVKDEESALR
ncbi:MAG TPA: DUF4388 domain-containing protein [Blastocatellia bacterium]|nr:DUF4388 domain-containing protein [Blastocatellia bacterium]